MPGSSRSSPLSLLYPPLAAEERPAHGVLVIESRPIVCSGLRALALVAGEDPVTAPSVPAAMSLSLAADAVAIVGLRDVHDIGVLVEATHTLLDLPVVCVLDCESGDALRLALQTDADGFVLSDLVDADTLRETLQAVRAGARVVPPELLLSSRHHGSVLTVRCRDVLQLVAEGLRDEEISERLGMSTSSVRKHIRSAEYRLQARTRVHALAMAARAGLLKR